MTRPALKLVKNNPGSAPELDATIKEYLAAIRQAGRSPATLEKYGAHLERLITWLAGRGVRSLADIDRALLREWGASLHDHWSPATVKQCIAATRSFLKWARDEEIINEPLHNALRLPRVPSKTQRTLAGSEIRRLIDACDFYSPKGIRDAALVSLLVDSGLRASEVCRLRLDEVRLNVELLPGLSVNILTVKVKGGAVKPGYFGQHTADLLQDWLDIRSEIAQPGTPELFVSVGGTRPGTAFDRGGLRVILRNLGQKAGVKGVSPHAFRRAFACLLEEAGASTRTIQELGRWEDLSMVLAYTRAFKAGQVYNDYGPIDFIFKP